MTQRTTPSGVVIDDSTCWCGAEATTIAGVYIGAVGPIEVPLCAEHQDSLLEQIGVYAGRGGVRAPRGSRGASPGSNR